MKACIISDQEYSTEASENIRTLIKEFLRKRNFDIDEVQLERDGIKPCMGCFGCWTKKPGECVIPDEMSNINKYSMTSDAVFYICPIIFGQYSANMKNVIDRWLPNILPFFEIRPDGSTMHSPRYKDYPKSIMIGYGASLSADDAQLFTDISKKHRNMLDIIIYDNDQSTLLTALDNVKLVRVGGHL